MIEPDSTVTTLSIGKPEKNNSSVKKVKKTDDTVPWGIHAIGADLIKNYGKSIKVGVLDTGISAHPDLNIKGGVSFVPSSATYSDDNGHGTHVAGTIAALDNKQGVVGAAPKADLYAIKVLDSNGNGTYSQVIQGIEWAIDNNIEIINMSFGGPEQSETLHEAIAQATSHGILVIAAAGNTGYGEETELFPARYNEVVSVGAVTKSFRRSSYSSTGAELDIVAPGTDILSTAYDQGYATLSGTSMAAPHVTGAAAALWSKNKKWTAEQIKAKLFETATPEGDVKEYGHGMLNLARALGEIDGPIPPIEEVSDFDVNQWDRRVLSYDQDLSALLQSAQTMGYKDLASRIDETLNQLRARNLALHALPSDFSESYSKEESVQQAYDVNEYFRLSSESFNALESEYQNALQQYANILEHPTTETAGLAISSEGVIGQGTIATKNQVVSFPETLDNSYNRSIAVNIPYLTSVNSITSNNGTATYTISGTTVTVTAGGRQPN
ncbi:S8 family peptidase [Cohnella ginsengisoli]|uniref:S8 family peptidase n=1 Tax=Cohnella ginsengisoli TaxID=425004 RepID=A0A9X4QPQ8_9BACL|nr:S8 family peptidase [Cohnella ginsengisoli]MDG0794163.1 S8 family peptidase [Cohnella ginsengisoli]